MSYTKGPWVYSKHRATHDCCIHQVGADDSKYGYIQPDDGGVVGSSEWIWINDDDGYLIAAAPDLYEALKAAIECGMVPASSARDGGAVRHSKQAHVADQIRAALAKAEGRNND